MFSLVAAVVFKIITKPLKRWNFPSLFNEDQGESYVPACRIISSTSLLCLHSVGKLAVISAFSNGNVWADSVGRGGFIWEENGVMQSVRAARAGLAVSGVGSNRKCWISFNRCCWGVKVFLLFSAVFPTWNPFNPGEEKIVINSHTDTFHNLKCPFRSGVVFDLAN